MNQLLSFTCLLLFFLPKGHAVTIQVVDEQNRPLSLVMVTQKPIHPETLETSDGGYPVAGLPFSITPEITKFTDEKGFVNFAEGFKNNQWRFRKYGHQDKLVENKTKQIKVSLSKLSDPHQLALQKPANVWLGALDIGNQEDKIIFKMQCGYCHQQGSPDTRIERSAEDWSETIQRMIRYGSRLSSDLQKSLSKKLELSYRHLREKPQLLAAAPEWDIKLKNITLQEWRLGDEMSQIHDMLVGSNGLIYVADNIQDRLYEVDVKKNQAVIYKVPHLKSDRPGGLIAGRLKDFPRHDSTSNAHSLAQSKVDGHIFITPSAQQRLIEFDPTSKKFTIHQMDQGFYPHTIRIDAQDNVWFTLALSNQVAMFDRKLKTFRYYDLPARNFKEKFITKNIYWVFKLINLGIPLPNLLSIDRVSTSVPLVYGIDITADGKVWFARLHTKEIGFIEPRTHEIKMIETPFWGPRRLRSDQNSNLWITSFGESKIAKYQPAENKFTLYELPVNPIGSETPYSLNIEPTKNQVWVTGNQSDAIHILDIKSEKWLSVPFPRKTTFTRDVEFSHTGIGYTSNSNFPSWQIEDSQPTLIEIKL